MSTQEVPSEFLACLSDGGTQLSLANRGLTSLPEWIANMTGLTRLELSGNQLTTLPGWIGNLTELTRLELSGNQLTTLPDWIGNLTRLSMLHLDGNKLTTLPESLGSLRNLTMLHLDDNELTVLPESFGVLTGLTMLYLGHNQLSAVSNAIGNLDSLTTLYLYGNQLSALPESLSSLTRLTTLYLGKNRIEVLPESIGRLTALTSLDVSGNRLTFLPKSIGRLTALTSLDVSGNRLTFLPESMGRLASLSRIEATGNRLTALPESLGHLTALTILYLSGNQLTALPESLGGLAALTSLDLSGNQLTALPESLGGLAALTSLDLSGNQLTALPESLGGLAALTSLDLSGNQLTALPESLGGLAALTSLYAANNHLAVLPTTVGRLTALTMLYLDANQLTSLPDSMAMLSELAYLHLAGNKLRAVPDSVRHLRGLTHLNLEDNQLSELPEWIGTLHILRELWLRGNMLGALPVTLASLRNLDFLYASGNRFASLPESLRGLPHLRRLFLNNNQLNSLPTWLSELRSLTHLYLSGNQLTSVPESIGRLTALTHLNLAGNRLESLPDSISNLESLELIALTGNPLRSPLAEIALEGTSAVRSFMGQVARTSQEQWGSKMVVVGEGATGKTSLVKILTGQAYNPHEPTTHGIQISSIDLCHPVRPNETMSLASWDFGGQDIYHATHQFFLSDRALFLLLWNSRLGWEQAKLPYWLDIIKARAPAARVILVATHSEDRPPDLPLADLRHSYPQIIANASVDNATGRGIDQLRQVMAEAAADLPLMGSRWPTSWLMGAEAIRGLAIQHATPEALRRLLAQAGVTDQVHQTHLLRALHALGDILYYDEDEELADTVILHPQWVTAHISKVLDSDDVARRAGLLSRQQVQLLWFDLDVGLRDRFLRLMEKFDLSYRIHDSSAASLIVERLPWEAPDYQTIWRQALTKSGTRKISIRYKLNTIPPGVPTWFIAREHRFTTGLNWRSGALLCYAADPRVVGLIRADRHNRTIELTVSGPTPQMFFSLLQDGFESTLHRYEGLEVQRLVPCICRDSDQPCQHQYNYYDLTRRLEASPPRLDIECPKSLRQVSVNELLFGLPASTGDQILSRLESIDLAVADFRAETAWAQSQFLKAVRNNQILLEAQCPSIFTITPITRRITALPGIRRFELNLYCEQPGAIHPLGDRPYVFEKATEWFEKIRPYLAMLLTVLKHAAPLVGPVLGLAASDLSARVNNETELMQAIIDQFPNAIPDVNSISTLLAIVPRTDIELDSDYRAVYALLDALDPAHHWGGLNRVRTPEDQILWLCRDHTQELRA